MHLQLVTYQDHIFIKVFKRKSKSVRFFTTSGIEIRRYRDSNGTIRSENNFLQKNNSANLMTQNTTRHRGY
jgi:hypothetical protein